MNNPFFSVLVTTYNSKTKLKLALESVLNQTYKNYEIIIIDDGSNDGTEKFINEFKKKNNIKYFRQENSGGPASPRNFGLRVSTGQWISFLDSDDIWYSNKLEVTKYYIDKYGDRFQLFHHKENLINANKPQKKIVINCYNYEKETYYNLLINGNICSTSATTVNSKFIKKNCLSFNESKRFTSVEDYDFWLKIAHLNGRFFHINFILGEYILHNNNLTKNVLWHLKKEIKLIYHHLFFFSKKNLQDKKKIFRNLYNKYFFRKYYLSFINNKDIKDFFKLCFFSIKNLNIVINYIIKRKRIIK